jgi:16S rRNA (adenine1518-N6/adenine1519-N6)-dimethyltransferase
MKAKKSLGQNFLKDEKILKKIIEAGEISADDIIIEVGAGRGALTAELLKKAGKVVALEIDKDLIPELQKEFGEQKKIQIINQDVLTFAPPLEPYKVIANIPYYITSPIIRHFLQRKNQPTIMVLLIQKEVAERIVSKEHSILSLTIRLFADAQITCTVPRTAFTPQPKVESAVIKITTLKEPRIQTDPETFFKLIKIAFAQPRKTLANNLANGLLSSAVRNAHLRSDSNTELRSKIEKILQDLTLDPKVRAQKLSFPQWEKLMKILG